MGHKTHHDGVVGSDAVGVPSCFECLLEDQNVISMIGNHDILVARIGLDGEMTGVICVELADGDSMDVEFIGRRHWIMGGK